MPEGDAEETSTDCENKDGSQIPAKASDTPCPGALQ